MNEERQIRFLYPPIVVLLYFCWGYFYDSTARDEFWEFLKYWSVLGTTASGVIALLAGGSLVLAAGFILGTVTYLAMRIPLFALGKDTHEIPLSSITRIEIMNAVLFPSVAIRPNADYTMATVWLDMGLCDKGVHEWIVRRWNAFNISISICLGILLTGLVFWFFWHTRVTPPFWKSVGAMAIIVFAFNAYFARYDTMRMLRFSAEKIQHDSALNALKRI